MVHCPWLDALHVYLWFKSPCQHFWWFADYVHKIKNSNGAARGWEGKKARSVDRERLNPWDCRTNLWYGQLRKSRDRSSRHFAIHSRALIPGDLCILQSAWEFLICSLVGWISLRFCVFRSSYCRNISCEKISLTDADLILQTLMRL